MPPWPHLDPGPFHLDAGDGDVGALLLHGFSGAPTEVRGLGEHLAARGVVVSAPLLPGHGVDHHHLERSNRRAWRQAAHEALQALQARCTRVVVVGQSMGGLLALELAARRLPADERLRLLTGLPWAEDPRLGGVDAVVVTDILGPLSAGHRALLGRALVEKLRPPALLFTIPPPASDAASAQAWAQGQPGYTFRAEPIGENGRAGSLLVGRRCS